LKLANAIKLRFNFIAMSSLLVLTATSQNYSGKVLKILRTFLSRPRLLHRIVLSLVGQCRCWCRWIGRALKHCYSRWDHLGIIFCRKVITTSGIRRPSWNFWGRKCRAKSTYTPVKTLPQNIGIATEIASISVSVAKLLLLPVCRPPSWISDFRLYLAAFPLTENRRTDNEITVIWHNARFKSCRL